MFENIEANSRASMEKKSAVRRAIGSRQAHCAGALRICALLTTLVTFWSVNSEAETIRVDATPSHVVNSFSPPYALGSTVDRVPSNATDPFFKPEAIEK